MKPNDAADVIELTAVSPDGDLACDFTIASDMAREGLREALAGAVLPPPREIEDGVEVTFRADGWDAVQRYVNLEAQCCSFLTLHAERGDDGVLLRVTGRPEARELIRNIFAAG